MAQLGRGQPVNVTLTRTAAAEVFTKAPGTPYVFADVDVDQREGERFRGRFVLVRGATAAAPLAGDVAVAETFSVTADATRGAVADVAVGQVLTLTVDATVTSAAATPRPALFTAAAELAAQAPKGGRVVVVRPSIPPVAGSADVAITQAFAVTAAASLAVTAAAPVALTFGLAAAATVTSTGAATVPLTFGLSVAAVVTSGAIRAADATGGTGRGPGITAGAESPSLTITGRSTSGPTMTGG